MSHYNRNNSNNNLSIINFSNSNHPKFLKNNPPKLTDSLSSNLISGLKSMTRLENFGKNLMSSKDKNLESNESSRRTSRTSISLVLVDNIEKEELISVKPSKNELPKDTKSDSDIDLESNNSEIPTNNIINNNKTFSMSSFNSTTLEPNFQNTSNTSIHSGCYVSYKSASEDSNISKSNPYSPTPKNIPNKSSQISPSNSSSSLIIKKVYTDDTLKFKYSNSSIYNQLASPIISQNPVKCNSLHYENESFNITENDKNYNLKIKDDKIRFKNGLKPGKQLECKYKHRRRSNSSKSQHMSPSSSTSKEDDGFRNVKFNYSSKVGKLKRVDDKLLIGCNRSKSNILHSRSPKRPDKLNLSVQANSTSKITVIRPSTSKSNVGLMGNISKRSAFSTNMLAFDSNTMTHVPSENIKVMIEKDKDNIEKIIVLQNKNHSQKFNESFNNDKSTDKSNITPTDKSKHWASHKRNDSKNSNKSALSKHSGLSLHEGVNSASATMTDRPLVYFLEKRPAEEQAKRRKVFLIFFFVLFIITVIVIAFLFLLARG